MGCLLYRKAQIIFVTASSLEEKGKNRKVVVDARNAGFTDCSGL
jgi:hypothetical protein